jgi:hypothetical protein
MSQKENELWVMGEPGRYFVVQGAHGTEICGPFRTRDGAMNWLRDHGPESKFSKLEASRDEIDRVFGAGFSAANPSLLGAALVSARIDDAAALIARAIIESKVESEGASGRADRSPVGRASAPCAGRPTT